MLTQWASLYWNEKFQNKSEGYCELLYYLWAIITPKIPWFTLAQDAVFNFCAEWHELDTNEIVHREMH